MLLSAAAQCRVAGLPASCLAPPAAWRPCQRLAADRNRSIALNCATSKAQNRLEQSTPSSPAWEAVQSWRLSPVGLVQPQQPIWKRKSTGRDTALGGPHLVPTAEVHPPLRRRSPPRRALWPFAWPLYKAAHSLTSMSAASAAALAAAAQQLAAGRPAACLAVLAALAPDQREALPARRLQALCHIQLAGDAVHAASTSSSWWKVS